MGSWPQSRDRSKGASRICRKVSSKPCSPLFCRETPAAGYWAPPPQSPSHEPLPSTPLPTTLICYDQRGHHQHLRFWGDLTFPIGRWGDGKGPSREFNKHLLYIRPFMHFPRQPSDTGLNVLSWPIRHRCSEKFNDFVQGSMASNTGTRIKIWEKWGICHCHQLAFWTQVPKNHHTQKLGAAELHYPYCALHRLLGLFRK